jgi:hypothetical protein
LRAGGVEGWGGAVGDQFVGEDVVLIDKLLQLIMPQRHNPVHELIIPANLYLLLPFFIPTLTPTLIQTILSRPFPPLLLLIPTIIQITVKIRRYHVILMYLIQLMVILLIVDFLGMALRMVLELWVGEWGRFLVLWS